MQNNISKIIFSVLIGLSIVLLSPLIFGEEYFSSYALDTCSSLELNYRFTGMDGPFYARQVHGWQSIRISNLAKNTVYKKIFCRKEPDAITGTGTLPQADIDKPISNNNGIISLSNESSFGNDCWTLPGKWIVGIELSSGLACELKQYTVQPASAALSCTNFALTSFNSAGVARPNQINCYEPDNKFEVSATITNNLPGQTAANTSFNLVVINENGVGIASQTVTTNAQGQFRYSNNSGLPQSDNVNPGKSKITIGISPMSGGINTICSKTLHILPVGECIEGRMDDDADSSPTEALNPYQICNQLSEDAALGNPRAKCIACIGEPGSENARIWTAVGCIQINATTMVTQILRIAMGIAGGIALIMILAAGFMLSVSQGDPKRVSEARELITSAIVGLLFIIFSVTILQYIGVTLFRIPGFGG